MTKKEIKSAGKIAGVYTGLILGAGFASGRELLNFFARYGNTGYLGLIISGIIFAFCGWAVLDICFIKKINTYERFSSLIFGKYIGKAIEYGTALFLLVLFATMLAALGATFNEAFSIPNIYGAVFLGVFCLVVFNKGAKAFVELNSFLSPVMVAGGIFIGLYSLFMQSAPVFNIIQGHAGKLWFAQAVIYSCYNIVTAISVLTTLGKYIESRKAAKYGGIMGGLSLTALGASLSIPLIFNFDRALGLEIPMLFIVNNYGHVIRGIYLFVLLSAIATTAVGNGYAFVRWLAGKINMKPVFINIFAVSIAMFMSAFGFSTFVTVIYPVFGVIGMIQIICIGSYALKNRGLAKFHK